MGAPDLPPKAETWAQFERIIGHSLFVRAANHQALLRFLILERYKGSDDFTAKRIAFEVFKRNSSIAKVEGRTLRLKLSTFYERDGSRDAITILLPRKSFRPEIHRRDRELDEEAMSAHSLLVDQLEDGSPFDFLGALELSNNLLDFYPGHSRILGAKALVHLMRIYRGASLREEWKNVEQLLGDIRTKQTVFWEVAFARACFDVGYCRWAQAMLNFQKAMNLGGALADRLKVIPWYTFSLAAQLRFEEALDVLREDGTNAYGLQDEYSKCQFAMMLILAGDLRRAMRYVERAAASVYYHQERADTAFKIPIAIIHDANDAPLEALAVISTVVDDKYEPMNVADGVEGCILGAAARGLFALFTGLSGDAKKAQTIYEEFKRDRGLKGSLYVITHGDRFYRVSAFNLALAAIGASDLDGAVEWLSISLISERDPLALWMHILPFFRCLHGRQEFRTLVSTVLKRKLIIKVGQKP